MCACKKSEELFYAPFEEIIKGREKDRSLLIPILQDLQKAYGYLPMNIIGRLSQKTGITVPDILGVATFYSQFRLTPLGKHVIKLCCGTACHVNGCESIGSALCKELGIAYGETTKDELFTIETVACLGCCSLSPVMMIDEKVYGRLTPEKAREIIKNIRSGEALP